jgi:hypothetical protein
LEVSFRLDVESPRLALVVRSVPLCQAMAHALAQAAPAISEATRLVEG